MSERNTKVPQTLRSIHAVLLFFAVLLSCPLSAADVDNDGLDDAWETANGYSTLLFTRIVHVDAVNGSDSTGDGLTATTALQSIGAALSQNLSSGNENVVLVAPGTYSGASNRELDFNGKDIWLRSSAGASQTVVDLEGAGRFLSLTHGETTCSRLEGFTVRNGYKASQGTAVHLYGASLTIRDCVFEDNKSGRKVVYVFGDWIDVWWEDANSTAAVYAEGAPVLISGTVFRRNYSAGTMNSWMLYDNAGALILADADGSVVEGCLFAGNEGKGAGAVAMYETEAVLRNCRFVRNVSSYQGGAVSASTAWTMGGGGGRAGRGHRLHCRDRLDESGCGGTARGGDFSDSRRAGGKASAADAGVWPCGRRLFRIGTSCDSKCVR